MKARRQTFTKFEGAPHIFTRIFGIIGGRTQTLRARVVESLFRGVENFAIQLLCAHIGVVENLLEQQVQEDHGQDQGGQENEACHDEVSLARSPSCILCYDSVSARSLPYSLSLLCRVLRLTPRSSAARVLLLPVAAKV